MRSILYIGLLLFATFTPNAFPAPGQPILSFEVTVAGTGAPVILIPGLACSREVWNETVTHLNAEGFQTHALTLAGFGGTKPITADHYLVKVREDLARYIREQHLEHPAIIGHSLGGFLALSLAAEHPELTGKVISVDGLPFLAGIMSPGTNRDAAEKLAAGLRANMLAQPDEQYRQTARQTVATMVTSPENVDRELKVDFSSDRATVAQAFAELLGTDLRPEMAKIKSPLLVLGSWINYKSYGATHQGATALYASQFQGAPSVRIVMSDTAKHFIQLDAPDWFYSQVDSFLK